MSHVQRDKTKKGTNQGPVKEARTDMGPHIWRLLEILKLWLADRIC